MPKNVKIKSLKQLAADHLPEGSALRDVLLAEPDEIPADEYAVKLGIWLRLLRHEEAA